MVRKKYGTFCGVWLRTQVLLWRLRQSPACYKPCSAMKYLITYPQSAIMALITPASFTVRFKHLSIYFVKPGMKKVFAPVQTTNCSSLLPCSNFQSLQSIYIFKTFCAQHGVGCFYNVIVLYSRLCSTLWFKEEINNVQQCLKKGWRAHC